MQDLLTTLRLGGVTMIPLGLCSLIGVMIILERLGALRHNRVIDPRVLRLIDEYDDDEQAKAALITCQRARGPFARIIEEVIRRRHLDHAQAIESMHAVGRTELTRLERGLTLLEIIGSTSPFLGLLGTVMGMITMFKGIAAPGAGNAQLLSQGISEALITTVAGLFIAIPAVAFHSILAKRVDDLAVEMQDRATSFLLKVQSHTR
jgi:biopolymer transport protein ExbB